MSITESPSAAPDKLEPATTTVDHIVIIDQSERELFDERFRAAVQTTTPLPAASDALVAYDSLGNVLGACYIHIRHLMGPFVLAESAPSDTLTQLAGAITDQLRATVRESITAQHADPPELGTDLGLSYDVYVAPGFAPPEGFERIDVEVWRRRVC